jgi:hypothetical protein
MIGVAPLTRERDRRRARSRVTRSTVAQECKRRNGGEPCVKIYAADMVTVVQSHDCAAWCPLLQKPVDDLYSEAKTDG